jgi:NADH-quinone oxidoreductase subunit L
MHESFPAVFNLTWLIPLLPLLSFGLIILFFNRWERVSHWIAIGSMALSFVVSQMIFWTAIGIHTLGEEPFHVAFPWLPMGEDWFTMGVLVDPLTVAGLFMVPLVCLMIFIYSVGYMHGDPRYSRFFAYISLFACGMLGLVVADNLLMLFIFWEIMGLCSYLLIGFWFDKDYPDPKRITPSQAGMKAFITTRIGDVIMFVGMLYLYSQTGYLSYERIFAPETLHTLAEASVTLPLVGTLPVATVIATLIFGGAVGKSSQFPLHVWLPDAMEGPTPVSALIHAATMVSAGVFMVARMFPIFVAVEHGPQLSVVAFIGTFTAFFAATIAVAQDDIKRVLAYSTVSQLGYMIAALGIGAYIAGVFHLLTHAFFKALLFLGSGSVIHSMEHAHHEVAHGEHGHEPFDPNDMTGMGGLLKRMPFTAWTFIIGGLALSGFPIITAGFWSKDEIFADAWSHGHTVVFWTLALAALLTAFYTGRQICMTFLGKPRTKVAEHVPESVAWVTVPLVILAFFAVVGGWVGIPADFPLLGGILYNPFHHFIGSLAEALHIEAEAVPFSSFPLAVSLVVALGGLFLGWLVYGWKPMKAGEPDPLVKALGPVHTLLRNKYYVDEIYAAVFIRPTIWVANHVYAWIDRGTIDGILHTVARGAFAIALGNRWFDRNVVDRAVNLVGNSVTWTGRAVRPLQTGRVQNYLLVALIPVLLLIALYMYLF